MDKQQEPRLRFKEFTGAWEEKTIFELAQDNKLNNGVFNDKNKAGSGYKLINVLDMYLENDIDENTLQLLDLSHDEFLRNKVNYGDVFFTRSSLVKEGIAYSNAYLGSSNDVTYDGHLIKLTPNKNLVSPIFLNYELKTAAVRRQFIIGGKTTTMTTIGQQEIGESIVMLPSLPEQTHLGLFFRRLDSQIAESRAVLEKSRQLKKAMLAKMFPANGEKIPKIRFKGFEGEWNVWKLGAFGKATSGTSLESEFCENGKYKVISIGSYSEESTYTEQGIRANKNDKTENRILNKNDLTMILNDKTSSGRIIGRVLLIDQNDTYVYNQRTQRIEIDQEHFIPLFLYHLLNAENIRQKIISSAQGNTQIYVNWSNIKNLEYLIPPSKAEQTAISDFFRQLDETIELQSAEVEKLNQLKKGLLAAMLV